MRRGWMFGPLRDVASEGGDGGSGGGSGAGAFDPAKFQKDIADLVNRTVNGAIKNLEARLKPKSEGTQDGDGDGKPDAGAGEGTGKPDDKTARLEKQLQKLQNDLEAERKARTETESKAKQERLQGVLRTELLKHVPAERVDAAMRIFGPDVRYSDDGSIIGGDDQPIGDFISSAIKSHEYLLPPKPVGGAGAAAGQRSGGKTISLDSIKPGMSAEDLDAARAEVARVAQAALLGK